MLYVEIVTACVPGYVAVAIYVRRFWHKRKHARSLANIARMERELGMRGAPRSPLEAATAWQNAAHAKAANYSTGSVAAAIQAQAAMVANFNQAVQSGRWARNIGG